VLRSNIPNIAPVRHDNERTSRHEQRCECRKYPGGCKKVCIHHVWTLAPYSGDRTNREAKVLTDSAAAASDSHNTNVMPERYKRPLLPLHKYAEIWVTRTWIHLRDNENLEW
jgi:hypothetical protein